MIIFDFIFMKNVIVYLIYTLYKFKILKMKIQINGFDIEINTEDTNMVVKVLDASGKELSNNTYAQSTDANASPDAVDMPSAEDTASDNPEDTTPDDDDTINGDDTNPAQDTPNPGEGTEGENQEITDDEMQEGLIPSFEQFKKINEAKKKEEAKKKDKKSEGKWKIYIPEEGHWPIKYDGDDKEIAKQTYLKWANRKTLPKGSSISKN